MHNVHEQVCEHLKLAMLSNSNRTRFMAYTMYIYIYIYTLTFSSLSCVTRSQTHTHTHTSTHTSALTQSLTQWAVQYGIYLFAPQQHNIATQQFMQTQRRILQPCQLYVSFCLTAENIRERRTFINCNNVILPTSCISHKLSIQFKCN